MFGGVCVAELWIRLISACSINFRSSCTGGSSGAMSTMTSCVARSGWRRLIASLTRSPTTSHCNCGSSIPDSSRCRSTKFSIRRLKRSAADWVCSTRARRTSLSSPLCPAAKLFAARVIVSMGSRISCETASSKVRYICSDLEMTASRSRASCVISRSTASAT